MYFIDIIIGGILRISEGQTLSLRLNSKKFAVKLSAVLFRAAVYKRHVLRVLLKNHLEYYCVICDLFFSQTHLRIHMRCRSFISVFCQLSSSGQTTLMLCTLL
jgi:hypothetical protein